MGWFAWDLMHGVDLLLWRHRRHRSRKRIILLGAVARRRRSGGGHGRASIAASRLLRAVQLRRPATRRPVTPASRERPKQDIQLPGPGSYWDSTRGLRLGGRDDFLHWVIVASHGAASSHPPPRFSWDGEHDPVWKRLRKIYDEFYQAPDRLDYAQGLRSLERPASPGVALQQHRSAASREDSRGSQPLVSSAGELLTDEYSNRRKPEELDGTDTGNGAQDSTPPCARHRCRAGPGARDGRVGSVGKARLSPADQLASEQSGSRCWEASFQPASPACSPSARPMNLASTLRSERVLLETEPGRCGTADHSERSPFPGSQDL